MIRCEYKPGATDKCNDYYDTASCAANIACCALATDWTKLLWMSANQRDHTPIDSVATSGHMTDCAAIGCY